MTKKCNISSNTFDPTYTCWGIEDINNALPIYIKACRNVNGINTYREYQRQIIGKTIRFLNAETNSVCIIFGINKNKTLLDNLQKCYEWIYNVEKLVDDGVLKFEKSRHEKIYIDINNQGHYMIP